MIRRFFKWLLTTVIIIFVLIGIAAISMNISHRVQPNSVLEVELNG